MGSKKKGPLEKVIQKQILHFLVNVHGIFAWPNKSVGIYDAKRGVFRKPTCPFHLNGVSDILGIFEGKPLAIEVKSGTGVVSDVQIDFINRFNRQGGLAFVARSVEDVRDRLKLGFLD